MKRVSWIWKLGAGMGVWCCKYVAGWDHSTQCWKRLLSSVTVLRAAGDEWVIEPLSPGGARSPCFSLAGLSCYTESSAWSSGNNHDYSAWFTEWYQHDKVVDNSVRMDAISKLQNRISDQVDAAHPASGSVPWQDLRPRATKALPSFSGVSSWLRVWDPTEARPEGTAALHQETFDRGQLNHWATSSSKMLRTSCCSTCAKLTDTIKIRPTKCHWLMKYQR